MLLFLLGCDTPPALPAFDGEALKAEFEGYEEWEQLPDWVGIVPSCDGTHGDFVQIWLNRIALADVDAGASTFSEGALWIKEGYQQADGVSKGLAVMRKVPGFNEDGGDWFWGRYDEDGAEIESGLISGCVGCHASGTDHVRVLTQSQVCAE